MELRAQPERKPPTALQALLDDALPEIDRAVGYAEASLMAYDPDVLLPVAFAVSEQREPTYAQDACRNEQLDPDVHKFRDLAGARLPVAILSREDPAARGSLRWQALIEPRGYRHELRAALVDGSGRCWGALNLLRDGKAGFAERHTTTVDRLGKSLAARIARAMVAGAEARTNGTVRSLWLDDRGEVLFATAGAREWLAGSNPAIPPVGGHGIAAAVALRVVAGERRGEGGLVSVRLRVDDGWVAVHGERITGPGGEPRGVSVVIEPAHPGAILPLAVAAFGLTPREAEVTREVLKGSDTRAISRALQISEYTVQDHLKSVFTKAGVRSRGALAHTLALSFG